MSEADPARGPIETTAEALELKKVLDLVARYATGPVAARRIASLPILSDPQSVEHALSRVSSYRRLLDAGEDLPIDAYGDVTPIFDSLKIQGARLVPESLVALARLAQIARQIRQFLKERQEPYPPLWAIARDIVPLRDLEQAVRRAIDFSSFDILDSASPALRRIRREIESTQQAIRKRE
jgi:DNA mismatch repair protein MutS2